MCFYIIKLQKYNNFISKLNWLKTAKKKTKKINVFRSIPLPIYLTIYTKKHGKLQTDNRQLWKIY